MDRKTPHEVNANSDAIMNLLDTLRDLADQEAALGREMKKIADKLCKFGLETKTPETLFPGSDSAEPTNNLSRRENESHCSAFSRSKIIPFPGLTNTIKSEHSPAQKSSVLTPILALPGIPLPANIPDYRLMLQRDGLILLAWDKRFTERGARYTAYWVTSIGVPRFYASKPLCLTDFSRACPDHKSYAMEDGIEFYGQEAPEYLVHVAPELMKSNPRHRELRATHINKLTNQENNVNYDYKYLLKTEKKRSLPSKRHNNDPHDRAS